MGDFAVQLRTRTLEDVLPSIRRVWPGDTAVERFIPLCNLQVTPAAYQQLLDHQLGLFNSNQLAGRHYIAVTLLEESSRESWIHWFGLWLAAHYPELETPAL